MGQMKRPGTQDREPRRSKQNGTGPAATKSPGRGNAAAARKISETRRAARVATDAAIKGVNGGKRATGARKSVKS